MADAVAPVAFALAVMYALSAANRATDAEIAATTPPTASVLMVTFLALGLLLARRPLPPSLAHPLLLAGIGLITLETLLRGPRIASTDLSWAIIGAGAVALRGPWFAAALAMVLLPFAAVAALVPGSAWAALGTTYHLDLAMASLLASVVFVARRRALVTMESARAELRDAAHEDPLTLLPNRRGLEASAGPIRERARIGGTTLQVAFVDLDGFRRVNDGDGHAAGDAVLCAVAAALREACRGTDIVARVGSDEFAILAPALAETRPLDERLAAAVRGATARLGHEIGISIGWCRVAPHDHRPVLDLVDEAGRVMHATRLGQAPLPGPCADEQATAPGTPSIDGREVVARVA